MKADSQLSLLPVDLLRQEAGLVGEFRRKSRQTGLEYGWHYLLDLSWSARLVEPQRGMWILDAGAGTGLMQWWLADHGANVLSVDRNPRTQLAPRLRANHRIVPWRDGDLGPVPAQPLRAFLPSWSPLRWYRYPGKLRGALALWRARRWRPQAWGTVYISRQDLTALRQVDDESVDAVVSISALEHNTIDGLRASVAELLRVLRPGGKLIATLGASKNEDWLHEPSQGWCLTEPTLPNGVRASFRLPVQLRRVRWTARGPEELERSAGQPGADVLCLRQQRHALGRVGPQETAFPSGW